MKRNRTEWNGIITLKRTKLIYIYIYIYKHINTYIYIYYNTLARKYISVLNVVIVRVVVIKGKNEKYNKKYNKKRNETFRS